MDVLRESCERKFPGLVLVLADGKRIDGTEYFWYNEAYHLHDFDPEAFLDLMREGEITLDLRMHIKPNGNIRNRGTAWRILDDGELDRAFAGRVPLLEYAARSAPDVQHRPHDIEYLE
jgi:hypothetical protein